MSSKNALGMMLKINFNGLRKQEILTKLYPVIEVLLFGVVSRRKIYDQTKVDEIRSDVYLHLWQLMLRDKIDFTRDHHQILVFLMMDITLTVGRYFQKKVIHTEAIDLSIPDKANYIEDVECWSDCNRMPDNIQQEVDISESHYQHLFGQLTPRLKTVIKRRILYKAYMLYKV